MNNYAPFGFTKRTPRLVQYIVHDKWSFFNALDSAADCKLNIQICLKDLNHPIVEFVGYNGSGEERKKLVTKVRKVFSRRTFRSTK